MRLLKRSPLASSLSRDFMIFAIGALLLLSIVTGDITLVEFSSALPSNNMTLDRNSGNLSEFQESNETCSTWIGIAPEESSENNTDIPCLQRVLEKCQPFNASLGYVLGSMTISIKGLTGEGACTLSVVHEIEMGESKMICIVPQGKMSAWTNWKRGDGTDATEGILDYCT
jgi:hypothetical protein